MGSFSIWHWLIVLAIVVLVFGTKKLKNIGTDLGGAVKGLRTVSRTAMTARLRLLPPPLPSSKSVRRLWLTRPPST